MKKWMKLVRSSMLWLLLLPYAVFYAGVASNQAVLFANNDKFPVMYSPAKEALWLAGAQKQIQDELTKKTPDRIAAAVIAYAVEQGMLDDTHCLMTSKTHLNLLADIFDFHNEGIMSIGDLLIDTGSYMKDVLPLIWIALIVCREKQRLA